MNLHLGLIAGIVAGIAGAAIWGGVAYALEVEIGWIAWGIGLLVGVAVAVATKGEGGVPAVGIAVVITALSICGGKYAAIHFALNAALSDEEAQYGAHVFDDDYVIVRLADDIAFAREQDGEQLDWPNGMHYEVAYYRSDYPADVLQDAEAYWNSLADEERASIRTEARDLFDQNEAMHAASIESFKTEAFKASFGVLDIVFFALGIFTAGRVAGGNMGSSTEEA